MRLCVVYEGVMKQRLVKPSYSPPSNTNNEQISPCACAQHIKLNHAPMRNLKRELEDHVVLVLLAGPECLRRELGVVHGVHVPHRLQREPRVLVVHPAALSLGVVQPVPRVELHGRLVRPQLHRPAGRGVPDLRHGPHRPFPAAVDDVVSVVPDDLPAHDLADARADGRGRPEVQRRAGDGRDAPRRREQLRVQHGVPRRVQPERVAQDVAAAALPAQVPVRVQQQVHRRRLVPRRRVHVHPQRVRARHPVRHVRVEAPRETLLSVEAVVVQGDVRGVAAADVLLHRPGAFAERCATT